MKDISYATTFLPQSRMSAFSHLAEIARLSPNVRFRGKADIPSAHFNVRAVPVNSG